MLLDDWGIASAFLLVRRAPIWVGYVTPKNIPGARPVADWSHEPFAGACLVQPPPASAATARRTITLASSALVVVERLAVELRVARPGPMWRVAVDSALCAVREGVYALERLARTVVEQDHPGTIRGGL